MLIFRNCLQMILEAPNRAVYNKWVLGMRALIEGAPVPAVDQQLGSTLLAEGYITKVVPMGNSNKVWLDDGSVHSESFPLTFCHLSSIVNSRAGFA